MSRLPTGWILGTAWAAYAGLLAFALPASPIAALAMAVPLALTGWFAHRFLVAAAVGLVHGVALASIGWAVGAFSGWPGPDSLPLAMALTTLLSWAFALAGGTMRIAHLLRLRTDDLEAARQQIAADAATVEAVYTASAAALIAVDKGHRIVSWNPGAQAIFGHPASKAIGADLGLLSALGHADDCTGRVEYVLDTGRQMSTFSGKLRHADGHVLDVEVRPRVLGRDGRVLLTVVDRTREVVLSDEVARQAQQQDRIIHNLDEVLYSVAVPSMNVLMMSRSVAQLTGRDAEDLADFRDVLALAHPDDKEEVLRRWEHARSGEKSVLRWRLRTALGQHVWVEDRVVPARDDDGRVVRVDGSIRRIFRELELERQAQRMMRWLDAMEPLTGGGAWSVDLRTGAWQWSNGMRRILAMDEEPEDGWDAWNAKLDPASAQALASLVADPANPHPLIVHVAADGRWQPLLLEPWVQRGADGEPIWLYGIVRPRTPKRRRRARLRDASPQQDAPSQAAPAGRADPPAGSSGEAGSPLPAADVFGKMASQDAGGQRVLSIVAAQAKHVRPDSPEAGRFIGMALARARMAAAQGLEADVVHALSDATAAAVEHAIAWARLPRVPTATGLSADDAPMHAARLAQAAQRQAIDAVLAAEDAAARERLAQADARVARIEQEAQRRIDAASKQAMRHAEAASEAARQEAARAQAAQQAGIEAERQAQEAAQAAKQTAAVAIGEAQRSRDEAMRIAEAAKEAAQREAARAEKAERERDRAEAARHRALEEAASAKRAALEEAERLRKQALAAADEARRLAEQEAEKARHATAAMQAAQTAREEAVQAAEQAKAQALTEAGKTRHAALQAAKEAQQRADAEAEKAQRAEEARQLAEVARQKAADAAEVAKAKALEDAEAVRREALEAAADAKRRAESEAQQAQQAAKALREAEKARAEALRAAHDATQRAAREEAARKAAMEEAKRATDEAMQKAQDALAAAKAEAQRAQAAEEARVQAEEAMARAVAEAQAAAEAAREEAARVQKEAREEARRATAAARAEAAKAEQAEKALAAAVAEAQRSRDQAIRQAEQAREEAVRQAEKAREEAVRQAQQGREEAQQELAQARLRADEAEARAEQAWEHARSRAVGVEQPAAEMADGGSAGPEPETAPSTPWVAEPEEPPTGMDVVWDDEIGWIPRPRGDPRNDSAEQLKAKAWQSEGKPKKGAGPWALD